MYRVSHSKVWIVSSREYLPHSNFQKRIVSAETIRGNTVFINEIKQCGGYIVLIWDQWNFNCCFIDVIIPLWINIDVSWVVDFPHTVFPHIVAAATILFWIHQVRKLFKFSFPLCNENLNSFLTRWGNYSRRGNYSREETIWGNTVVQKVWVTKLVFCINDSPIGGSFWKKDSLITHIIFDLCLFWYLADSKQLLDSGHPLASRLG